MPLLDPRSIYLLKLRTLPLDKMQDLASMHGIKARGSVAEISKRVLNAKVPEEEVNRYIKLAYTERRNQKRESAGVTHEVIERELMRVDSHIWGMVQGELDAHIQTNYVRKYHLYSELVSAVKSSLYDSTLSYVLCIWYNHWSTVVIEDLIAEHPNVVPTVKKVKDMDLFWRGRPWDLKITNLPKEWFKDGHDIADAIRNPVEAEEYLYRLQGAQRFGANNRLFLIIADTINPDETWKMKRDFGFLEREIRAFFDQESEPDEVDFVYGNTPHIAYAKTLFVVRN